jgi:hypothetical protein
MEFFKTAFILIQNIFFDLRVADPDPSVDPDQHGSALILSCCIRICIQIADPGGQK